MDISWANLTAAEREERMVAYRAQLAEQQELLRHGPRFPDGCQFRKVLLPADGDLTRDFLRLADGAAFEEYSRQASIDKWSAVTPYQCANLCQGFDAGFCINSTRVTAQFTFAGKTLVIDECVFTQFKKMKIMLFKGIATGSYPDRHWLIAEHIEVKIDLLCIFLPATAHCAARFEVLFTDKVSDTRLETWVGSQACPMEDVVASVAANRLSKLFTYSFFNFNYMRGERPCAKHRLRKCITCF